MTIMKKEYDFSKGVRGRFYSKSAQHHIPVYLNRSLMSDLLKLAEHKDVEIEDMVTELLDKDISIVKAVLAK